MKTQKYPNLTPWQPGQSGNPAGRKIGSKNISTIVQELLDQEADSNILTKSNIVDFVNGETITFAKAVVLATLFKALQGNMQAICWLAEQQERGAVVQERLTQTPVIISSIKPRIQSAVD